MAKTQDMTAYQTTQLAELDKQIAVWDQRLKQIDQKIVSATQTLQETITQMKGHMVTLVAAADEWLSNVASDPEVSQALKTSVTQTRAKISKLYKDLEAPIEPATIEVVSALSVELQALSTSLLEDLSTQANTFAVALDQAAANLLTHYGVQI